ncbi:MAG: exodeoxyribonuclease VII small subunit [candidate division KSB1 bacterium]|nr:exodeoxyribonuclease VII small subunit [candidate division KSB1 bacterium]MDZ7275536.1 exodeoxyribonuclease VII small subunit [candidate division KSB1 bacterium]MDZ7286152.1 exodeoxyribonuclease VII small subunit [candidate division KSB1 bacterium]MDZ7296378.1 exodeoxyribonuclease VII small subunit [candidate division KSB1 bacterium]MDZ7306212.1 exodeoxyribonuclease VII small subunit [candidate division KSB1 bacterium]
MSKKISFEEALARLDAIVQQLEQGQIPLEEAVKIFEEGVRLYRLCAGQLQEAEKKLQQLVKTEAGFQLELMNDFEIG